MSAPKADPAARRVPREELLLPDGRRLVYYRFPAPGPAAAPAPPATPAPGAARPEGAR